jgi:hypothetical protein
LTYRRRLALGRCQVRLSPGRPTILTEAFRGSPQSLQTDGWSPHDSSHPNSFQFINYHTIRRYTMLGAKSVVKNPEKNIKLKLTSLINSDMLIPQQNTTIFYPYSSE